MGLLATLRLNDIQLNVFGVIMLTVAITQKFFLNVVAPSFIPYN
jgi:hypothetical protein